jgi:polar amino acid transport system substrate-binding protein
MEALGMSQRLRVLLLLLVLVLPSLRIFAQDEAADLPDLGGREVTIAVENAYNPYSFIDEAGNAVGWDYDTFRDICKLLNCTPVFTEMAWDGMLLAVSQNQIDVAGDGITYTAERDETVDFGSLYQAYDQTLLVRGDEDRFTSADELKALDGFVVGTQLGTTNEITAHNLFGIDNVRSYEQFPAAIQALLNGDVDAVVVDRPAAEGYIVTQGNMKTVDEELSGIEGLAFAYPTGSDLVDPINQAMAAMQADGTWDDIYAKWFETASAE